MSIGEKKDQRQTSKTRRRVLYGVLLTIVILFPFLMILFTDIPYFFLGLYPVLVMLGYSFIVVIRTIMRHRQKDKMT
ncbi:hypothetical protein CSV61_16210 [Sporosarcina sp. P3]|nr:hypothetical protein CSV61_16210 [Sporosarcina sp. P3]